MSRSRRTGGAALACSRPGEAAVYGTLRQPPVGGDAATGSFRTVAACDSTATWRAAVLGETGLFRRGPAAAVAVVEFADPIRGDVVRVRASGTVRLG